MYKIIICEGKTDAILVAYYLEKVANWTYTTKTKKLPVLTLRLNDELNWYTDGSEHLAIWSVGGNSNFLKANNFIGTYNSAADIDNIFSKIIILTDRDDSTIEIIVNNLFQIVPGTSTETPQNNTLHTFNMQNQFGQSISFEVGFIVIPFDVPGAIETFLLNSLSSESEELKKIITIVENLIDNIIEAPSYLPKTRDKLKAKLGVTLAIISPEKVFSDLHSVLRGIEWEQFSSIQQGFILIKHV